MFPLDSLVLDLIFPATARPTPEQVTEGLGGEEVAQSRLMVDVDVDLPQIESEVSPTFLLRRRGDRRVFIVDEATAPLRPSRQQPIVARDLRPEMERLISIVAMAGARLGRMGTFGTWGDAVVVARSPRDLRAVMLLSWGLDPSYDLEGRRRAQPLGQREMEEKLKSFDKRLDELDDATILARIPPATLAQRGTLEHPLYVASVLSETDGTWDIRKSYELEKRVAATEMFSRIPGARQAPIAPRPPEPPPRPAAAAEAAPPAPPEPAKPAGPPIQATEIGGRVILRIPGERLDSETITAMGKRIRDIVTSGDDVSRLHRDHLEQRGGGFVAPLAFLSEVFLDGKPLDKRRFTEGATEIASGVRAMEALLPRYGAVWVLELAGGKRWITSEIASDVATLLPLLA